ncbi:hypothetical protein DEJ38_08755 [Kocuria rosea]|nr:hypothetical protein DEQ16_15790 [Dietzia maris]PWF81822.1 hypothetical protein DEJ38_08755 [Kocuria rosea]
MAAAARSTTPEDITSPVRELVIPDPSRSVRWHEHDWPHPLARWHYHPYLGRLIGIVRDFQARNWHRESLKVQPVRTVHCLLPQQGTWLLCRYSAIESKS